MLVICDFLQERGINVYFYDHMKQRNYFVIFIIPKVFEMEYQKGKGSEIGSQACLCCREKDQMLLKYEKLVQLLKRRIKKYSSNAMLTFNSMGSGQVGNFGRELDINAVRSRDSGFGVRVDRINNNIMAKVQSDQLKEKQKNVENKLNETRKTRLSEPSMMFATAPSSFNRNNTNSSMPKKINLSTQWLMKFTQLNKKLSQKQQRINILIDQILQVKNQYLYIRSIFLNFLKTLKMKDLNHYRQKLVIDGKGKDIISLMLHIYEYSEQEMKEIFGVGDKDRWKENILKTQPIDANKQVYIPRFSAKDMR